MRGDLKEKYFRWIMRSLGAYGPDINYLRVMHEIPFEVLIERDINRAEDGENLRYRFGEVTGIPDARIAAEIDILPCSILEMTAAMALRAGEQIFGTPLVREGAQWIFGEMVHNLGLDTAPPARVKDILRKMNRREYGRDGRGGLFYIRFTKLEDAEKYNMRDAELWYQMMAYINRNYSRFARIYAVKSTG